MGIKDKLIEIRWKIVQMRNEIKYEEVKEIDEKGVIEKFEELKEILKWEIEQVDTVISNPISRLRLVNPLEPVLKALKKRLEKDIQANKKNGREERNKLLISFFEEVDYILRLYEIIWAKRQFGGVTFSKTRSWINRVKQFFKILIKSLNFNKKFKKAKEMKNTQKKNTQNTNQGKDETIAGYKKRFLEGFRKNSDEEMMESYNSIVGNSTVSISKVGYVEAIYEEFKRRGFDFSEIALEDRGFPFNHKIKLVGKKIKVIENEDIEKEDKMGDEIADQIALGRNAYLISQQFVRLYLVVPATAQFPESFEEGVKIVYLGDEKWSIQSWVIAQALKPKLNGIGGLTRLPYSCVVRFSFTHHGLWFLEALVLNGTVLAPPQKKEDQR
jgi:hypothetical protein